MTIDQARAAVAEVVVECARLTNHGTNNDLMTVRHLLGVALDHLVHAARHDEHARIVALIEESKGMQP